MMNLKKNSAGFTAVEVVLILVIVAAVGFAGWRVYNAQNTSTATDTSSSVSEQTTTPESQESLDAVEAPKIDTKADLDSAENTLNELEKSNALDESQFDDDVNELL